MKKVYLFIKIIFLLAHFFHIIKSDPGCSGLIVPFYIDGSNCNVSGEISFSFDPAQSRLYAKQTNVVTENFDTNILCFNVLPLTGSSGKCQTFQTSASGNFTLQMSYCFNPTGTIFETVGIVYYNSSGLNSTIGTCNDANFSCTNADKQIFKQKLEPVSFDSSIDDYCTTPPGSTPVFPSDSSSNNPTDATTATSSPFASTGSENDATTAQTPSSTTDFSSSTSTENTASISSSNSHSTSTTPAIQSENDTTTDFIGPTVFENGTDITTATEATTTISPFNNQPPCGCCDGQQQQGSCPGLIVSYNVTGSQCSGTGNFNIFYNSAAQTLFVSQSNTTLTNIANGKLCATLEYLVPGGTAECVTYNTSASGNFTINIYLCDSPTTVFVSIGPILYDATGLSTSFGRCDNSSQPCSPTISPFLKLLPKVYSTSFPVSRLSIDDYCINASSSSPTPSPPPPDAIAPPTPTFDCNDPNLSYILKQTCLINGTNDPTVITQVINDTSTQIQDDIKNGTLDPTKVHDAGAFVYNTVQAVKVLNIEGAHSILDIINSIAVQPLQTLQGANSITNNSLLWYPSALPIVVAKTNADLAYAKDDSNLLLHSFTLNASFCANENSHEICYSKNSQVPSGDKNAEFCTTFNPTSLCNNASKAYLTLWKSLSFFALVKNNSLGIKTGVSASEQASKQQPQKSSDEFLWSSWFTGTAAAAAQSNEPQSSAPNQPVTFDIADRCSDGTYFKNTYGSNVGGVDANGIPSTTGSTVWVKRRSDENDLHVTKFKMASFVADSFVDAGAEVTKNDKHYTAECYQGTCTLLVDGNPTEPLVCSSGAKSTQAVIGGIGIFITVVGIFGFFFKSKTIPVISTIAAVVFNIFNDKNLPKKLKFFAYCYNATFLLYSLYLLLFAEQQITNTSKGMCTFFAVVGYILYISAIFLSVIMIIVTLDALGCWKPMIQKGFYVFTGKQRTYVPFIYSYGIPLLLTAIFAAALTSFFKRNDGYCWIRPDYAFLALWFPLILLLLTIPLYIILVARRWPNSSISKKIYSPLTISDDLTDYETSKRRRKAKEKAEDKKDDESIERGQRLDDIDVDEENDDDDEKIVLTNRTLARLIIPQVFLAIPLIAENLALYYAKLTGWHYLFFLTQAFHLIALHGINFIDKIPKIRQVWIWAKGKIMKKSKKNDEEEPQVEVEKPKKPPRGQRRENTLPNDIEDFEAVTLARESEIQNPRTERLRMVRRSIESEDVEILSREHELSEIDGDSSSHPARSYRRASSISIESYSTAQQKLEDDAAIAKEEARHLGSGDTASTRSLKSYTPAAASETEIPIKVHILRLDSHILLDAPFIREPVDEWLQDDQLPPYVPFEETLEKPGDWRHLDKKGVHLKFSDIPTGYSLSSTQSTSTPSREKESSESEIEDKLAEEVVNPNLPSTTYSDNTTQIIDSLPDIEQISRYDPNYQHMYGLDQHPIHLLSPDDHLPLNVPFIREPVELSTWNDIPPSYIPYVSELAKSDVSSSEEEELVAKVLHPNLPPQIFLDSATMVIDSLPAVEETAAYEPDYSEMYHFDKNPVHLLSPDEHLPLGIPFIRESIEAALAQGITPSYIPLDPRRPSIVSVAISEHQDEMVEEVLEAANTTSGLPPDKWAIPESRPLPSYEINMEELYKLDKNGLHYLSPTDNELPVDCPFVREPVEVEIERNRAPSYIPYDRDLALSDQREEEKLIKEVLDVKVSSLSEFLEETQHEPIGMGAGHIDMEQHEEDWRHGLPTPLRHSGSSGYILERHQVGNDTVHLMSPDYHLPLDYPFILIANEKHVEDIHHHHYHHHVEHEPIDVSHVAQPHIGQGLELSGYPEILRHIHYHHDTVDTLFYEREMEKTELVLDTEHSHHQHVEHEPIESSHEQHHIGKGVELSGYPEIIKHIHHHHETPDILVYEKQMDEMELSFDIQHQRYHHHIEHEPHETTNVATSEHHSIGKGIELSGYPEILVHSHSHHRELTETLVYEKQLEKTEFSKDTLNLPSYYKQFSATSEASTSIYQTPPETPQPYTLHYQTPPDNVSMATQFYQTPPETPYQQHLSEHPLSATHIHHHHHRHGSSGSELEFPYFKFKTLRDEDLVGPENVIHSDSTSLAEEEE